jgi:V8-like Glu-specific endopeptidase
LRAFPLGEVFAKGGVNVKFVVALTDRSPDSTAVVVALIGPDLVVTVVHCVDSTKLGDTDGFTFSSANGKIARVQKLISADTKKDLAIYKLDTGSFDHFTPNLNSSVDQRITVAGYDTTSGKWLQSSCSIKTKEAASASFTYECDTVPGMSGSAVLSNGEVIGLHVAHVTLSSTKTWVSTSRASVTLPLTWRIVLKLTWSGHRAFAAAGVMFLSSQVLKT